MTSRGGGDDLGSAQTLASLFRRFTSDAGADDDRDLPAGGDALIGEKVSQM